MAKFTKLPYQYSTRSITHPFQFIHIDLWGPYRILAHGKYLYFMTIVDDFTQATWTYLLKYKSQSFACLQAFCSYASTQFGRQVQTIRSDNALEFDSSPCQEYFSRVCIVHQTSCVDRPQQNGIVEREHRHLLEIARALRFHASLPLLFWGDAILTATHIINR